MFKKGLAVAVMISVLVLTACGGNGTPVDGGDGLSGSITIAGSTSVAPVTDVLAEEFMDLHPNVQIHVQSSGSGAGIRAAQENTADIGMSSRELTTEEKTTVQEVTIAMDGILIVVHKDSNLTDLTLEQVRKIYTGEITNWSQVGGKDAKITAVTRETGSGTRGAFEDIVMNKKEISSSVIVQGSTGAVRTAVENDPNAIGYISLAAINENVKALKINGVEGTMANIQNGTYEIARPFIYMTNQAPQGLVKAFLDFVLGETGQSLAQEEGLIPIN